MTKAYEFCKRVRSVLLFAAGETIVHGVPNGDKPAHWEAEFVITNFADAKKAAFANNQKKTGILSFNPNELTSREMQALGFKIWELDDKSKGAKLRDSNQVLWLIPQWLGPFISNGVELTFIRGEKFEFSVEKSPLDHRAGSLAFGVKRIRRSS